MKHIVVPVDGSEAANQAAVFAHEWAQASGAGLTLLYVYDAPAAAMLGFQALSRDEMEATKINVAKGSFDAAKRAIGQSGVKVETEVVIGHPGTEIVTFAKSRRADLVVMGNRGLSRVAGLLMGSVSEYVVRHAHCPVTIVR